MIKKVFAVLCFLATVFTLFIIPVFWKWWKLKFNLDFDDMTAPLLGIMLLILGMLGGSIWLLIISFDNEKK